ncbi:MAG: rod shape-determining protein MreD [Pontibacterium sp.]
MEKGSGGRLIILGTFLLAMVLTQIPLPQGFEWVRPEWVAMTLIYWTLAVPHVIGVKTAFVSGLIMDVVRGSVLGANALALSSMTFMTLLMYRRVRMYPLPQQAVIVALLTGSNQLILHWIQSFIGTTGDSLIFLLPALISGCLWPVMYLTLRRVRRVFRVS